MEKKKIKEIIDYIILGVAFVSILVLGIIEKQDVIKLIPALFGLFVYLLASKAFRIAYIFGAINSALSSIGLFQEGVYGSAFVNLILYVPLQIFTFIQWSKKKYKHSTEFRTLSKKWNILLAVGAAVAWAVCWLILEFIPNSIELRALDAICTIVGPITAVTTMYALIETIGYELLATSASFTMWLISIIMSAIAGKGIADITYLISTIFTLYCQICKTFTWVKLYKEQRRNAKIGEDVPQESSQALEETVV